MLIAVDLDDVLSDTLDNFIKFHNFKYKTSLKKSDFTSYELHDLIGISIEEEAKRLEEFDKSEYFDMIKPLKNSQKVISKLSKNHELVVITARTKIVEIKTKKWLKKFFPEIEKVVFISTDYRGYVRRKSEVCIDLGAKFLVEDKSYFIEECANKGINVIVIDYPWNSNLKENKKIKRINSWNEITKIII